MTYFTHIEPRKREISSRLSRHTCGKRKMRKNTHENCRSDLVVKFWDSRYQQKKIKELLCYPWIHNRRKKHWWQVIEGPKKLCTKKNSHKKVFAIYISIFVHGVGILWPSLSCCDVLVWSSNFTFWNLNSNVCC